MTFGQIYFMMNLSPKKVKHKRKKEEERKKNRNWKDLKITINI